MSTRKCRKCGEVFPLNKEHFGHQPNGTYRYTCRSCVRKNVKRHYDDDPYTASQRAMWRAASGWSQSERETIKRALVQRDGEFRCFYCKKSLGWEYHIDHMLPVSMGGKNKMENYALACAQCNQEKHNKTIDQYRQWLRERGEAVNF